MGRIRGIALLVGAMALVALCAPGAALAGTYSWSQPGEFTGANPEQKYGQPSWSYDTSGGSISSDGTNLVMSPNAGKSVTLTWSSPFGQPQEVAIAGSVGSSACLSWSLTDSSGHPLASGVGLVGGSISSLDTVTPGESISLTLSAAVAVPCSANVSVGITATTPGISLSGPSNNAVFLNGVPQFSGVASPAFDASNAVTVSIYSSSGALVQRVTTTAGPGGSFSVAPSGPLPNGIYSAVASQEDPIGQANNSAPVTFTLGIVAPPMTLNSLGGAPLTSSSPTFTGRAGTRSVDAHSVSVSIYAGSSASGTPVQSPTGSVNADGSFSVPVSAGLADGRYTAVAKQSSFGTVGFSGPVTFRIKAHGPDLTLTYPAHTGWFSGKRIQFWGQAGTALGDGSEVDVQLWQGTRAQGAPIGTLHIPVRGSTWSGTWPVRLPYGKYTSIATQTDDAGHTTTAPAHTFSLVKHPPTTVGFPVSLSRSRKATVPVACLAPLGKTCTGTVLVLTKGRFRTRPGGPAGQLRVLFAYVSIPGNQTRFVTAPVMGPVATVLRRLRSATVRVSASLSTRSSTVYRQLTK